MTLMLRLHKKQNSRKISENKRKKDRERTKFAIRDKHFIRLGRATNFCITLYMHESIKKEEKSVRFKETSM